MASNKQKERFEVGDRVIVSRVEWVVERVLPNWGYEVSLHDESHNADFCRENGWLKMYPDHSEMSKCEDEV